MYIFSIFSFFLVHSFDFDIFDFSYIYRFPTSSRSAVSFAPYAAKLVSTGTDGASSVSIASSIDEIQCCSVF